MPVPFPPESTDKDKKRQYMRFEAQLRNERSTWETTWEDLGDHFSPYAYQIDQTTTNQGGRRDSEVIDPQGVLSVRAAISGIMAGLTSPTRRWAELQTRDPELMKSPSVQSWCEDATERLEARLARSNLYTILPLIYEDGLVFGTGSATFLELPSDVLFEFGHLQMGTYSLGRDSHNVINMLSRVYRMTAEQMAEAFGKENLSSKIQMALKNQQGQAWFDVGHIIRPNPEWNPGKLLSKYKRYVSCYYEPGTAGANDDTTDKLLLEQGYDEFPIVVGRWKVRGQDIYGRGPALDVLGACRALQAYQYKTALAVDKELDPSLTAPAGMDLSNISLLPGAVNVADDAGGQLVPTHNVQFNIANALTMIQDLRQQIKRGLFEDLFLMIANAHGDMTAREIIERQEEKIQQLGPVILNLSHELLDPLISRAVSIMFRRGEMPPPPPELQGAPLKVEYVSSLAQAQQLIDGQAIVETVNFGLSIAAVNPGILDTLDTDESVREYARLRRAPPEIVRSADDVAATRQQQQAQAQQAEAQQAMLGASQTAKNLAQAPTDGNNALTDVVAAAGGQQ